VTAFLWRFLARPLVTCFCHLAAHYRQLGGVAICLDAGQQLGGIGRVGSKGFGHCLVVVPVGHFRLLFGVETAFA
jgi:hypothetical protein